MATLYIDSASFNNVQLTGSMIVSASSGIALQLKSSGSTIFSISGSAGEIFNISDRNTATTTLFSVATGSTTILSVDQSKNTNISGSLRVTGSVYFGNLITASTTITNVVLYDSASGQLYYTASSEIVGGSVVGYVTNAQTSSFATTGSNTFTGTQTITGSNGTLIYKGTTPTSSIATLAEIHANDDLPWLHRFYNDTFSTSSAVMAYYGHNDGRFVFHNESTQSIGIQVNNYDGTTGLLVYEDKVTFVNNVEVTGSLNVAGGITGSLLGTAATASYIDPTFISASAAASGFGSGGGGGVTSITAGDGISVNSSTGNVVITNTGGSGGISQGKVVAIVTGLSNLF